MKNPPSAYLEKLRSVLDHGGGRKVQYHKCPREQCFNIYNFNQLGKGVGIITVTVLHTINHVVDETWKKMYS